MSDDKPKEWLYFSSVNEVCGTRPLTGNYSEALLNPVDLIELAALTAAEAQLMDCNKIINNLHQQVQRAEAEIARMKEGLNSPAEQAMQQTCEKCGCKWTADEYLPCPVCKPALAGQCLNCDAEFEMSNSGCMDLLRKERAKLTDAEREIASEKSIAEHWKGNMNLARNERDYFQAENERLTKENAELKAMLNAANEILHDQDVHPAIAERNILTKQNEEQAKEIERLERIRKQLELEQVAHIDVVYDQHAEIIAVLEAALKKYADPETHSMDERGFVWSGDYFDCETAKAALAKLAEHRKLSDK